jgi:hypothetical protein
MIKAVTLHIIGVSNRPTTTGYARVTLVSSSFREIRVELRISSKLLFLAFMIIAVFTPWDGVHSTTLFVHTNAPPGGNGLSWETAFDDLQNALDVAQSPGGIDDIWVAEGTYRPDRGTGDRSESFHLVSSLTLLGGFMGGETSPDQRDPDIHPTILSGDLNGDDEIGFVNTADNSQHVVTGVDLVNTTIDGFIIEGGNADFDGELLIGGGGLFFISSGGLMKPSNASIRNCVFQANSAGKTFLELGNFGGGVLLRAVDASIESCRFTENRATNGGALGLTDRNAQDENVDVTVTISDCEFIGNESPSQSGGALYTNLGRGYLGSQTGILTVHRSLFKNNSAEYWGAWVDFNTTFLTVEDCDFLNNTSRVLGGAFGHIQSAGLDIDPVRIQRCSFEENQANDEGGGIWLAAADAIIHNSVFRGNSADFGAGIRSGTYFTKLGAQDLILVNCLFDGNVALEATAIFSSDNPVLRMTNGTVVYNEATNGFTGGIFTEASTVDVDNTIFFGNRGLSGENETAQIRHFDNLPIDINFSLIQGLTGNLGGTGNIDEDGIGDTAYGIPPGNNEDHFPFMNEDGWLTLRADTLEISAGTGGTIDFTLTAGEQYMRTVTTFF